MRGEVHDWVAAMRQQYVSPGASVVEIGALNVNGEVRDLFEDAAGYVGLDLLAGQGVDVVGNAHDLTERFVAEGSIDLVLCLETLEHDGAFWITIAEVWKALRLGGYFFLTVPDFSVPLHNEPDYWRFTIDAVRRLLGAFEVVVCEAISAGYVAVARKALGA